MADIRTIGIKFDPAPAKQGAAEAKKAVHDMATSVDRDLQKVEASGKQTGTAIKQAGDKIETAAKTAEHAVDRLGRNGGMARMAAGARTSAGQVSNGVIDMLDTFGLLDSRMGMMVRRVQSGINSVANLRGIFAAARPAMAGTAATATSAGAAMAEAGAGAATMAGGVGTATAGMGALGTAAAVALPIIIALAAALAGVAAIGAVFAALKAGIPKAAAFEEAETGMAVLLGSFDKAAEKMDAIKKFAGATPFESAEMIQGARYLEVFTQGLLNNEKGWTLVGDAAAAAQRDFGEVAMWVGRTYAALKGGQPIGEATMRLMEMGLITPQVKGAMDKLAESSNEGGKNFAKIWGIAETSLKRFTGTMALQSQTWNGLMSSLSDNWNLALAGFAAPVMDALKPALAQLVQMVQDLIPYAQAFGQALADGVTATIQIFRSGQIAEALKLGLLAAWEFGRANFVTMMLLAFEFVLNRLVEGLVNAITLPVRLFASLFGLAVDFVGKLLEGDLSGAMETVTKYFGDLGVSAVKMMAAMIYNALGKAFVDVVNVFRNAIYGVLQKAGDIASTVLVKAGKDPLAPIVAPAPVTFTPIDTSFGAIRKAANNSVGTGARDDFSAFMDKMVADAKANQPPKPELPAAPTLGGDILGGDTKDKGSSGAEKAAKAVKEQQTEVQRLMKDWGHLGKQIDQVADGSIQAIAGGMTDALTGLIMGTKSAKQAFQEMATSIVSDIIRMILQMQIQLALAAALRAMGVAAPGVAHSGGTVGATNLSTTGTRTVLPTYHTGGMATSEQTVKVERGESILTRKRAKELEMELAAQRGDRQQGQRQGNGEATIINVFDRNEIADAVVARPDAVVNAISRSLPAVRKMIMSGNRL